jgi:hypothetical protein
VGAGGEYLSSIWKNDWEKDREKPKIEKFALDIGLTMEESDPPA